MVTIRKIAVIFLCGAALLSCQREPMADNTHENLVPLEITVGGAKSFMNGDGSVEFEAGDEISIYDGTAVRKFVTEAGGANAIFFGMVSAEATDETVLTAVFPYDPEMALAADDVIETVIPRVQYVGRGGSFGSSANVSVGRATKGSPVFSMQNISSLIKLEIASGDIDSVLVTGLGNEIISGPVSVTLSDGAVTSVKNRIVACTQEQGIGTDGNPYTFDRGPGEKYVPNEVVLKPVSGKIPAGTYYIPVKSDKLAENASPTLSGARFLFYKTEGGKLRGALKYSASTVNLPLSGFNSGTASFNDDGLTWEYVHKVPVFFREQGHLYTSDGDFTIWPFPGKSSNSSAIPDRYTVFTTKSRDSAPGSVDGYKLYMRDVAPDFGHYHYSRSGFIISKAGADAYMEFSEYYGDKLISVGYSTYQGLDKTNIRITQDGSGIEGGESQFIYGPEGTSDPGVLRMVRWNLSGTDPGKVTKFHFNFSGSSVFYISQIVLTWLGPDSVGAVTTELATDVDRPTKAPYDGTTAIATLNGKIADGVSATAYGFYWRQGTSGEWSQQAVSSVQADGRFSFNLANLSIDSDYEYRAYADVNGTKVFGPVSTFRTPSSQSYTIDLTIADYYDGDNKLPEYSKYPENTPSVPMDLTFDMQGKPFTFHSGAGTGSIFGTKYKWSIAVCKQSRDDPEFNCLYTGANKWYVKLPADIDMNGRELKYVSVQYLNTISTSGTPVYKPIRVASTTNGTTLTGGEDYEGFNELHTFHLQHRDPDPENPVRNYYIYGRAESKTEIGSSKARFLITKLVYDYYNVGILDTERYEDVGE